MPWLWVTITLAAVVLMLVMAPYQALMPQLIKDNFDRGVGSYGLIFTFQAAGMVIGTIIWLVHEWRLYHDIPEELRTGWRPLRRRR